MENVTDGITAATSVTSPDTVSDVFHFGETRSRSRKKNTVAAMSAIEMIQNEIPTKSSCLSVALVAACVGLDTNATAAPTSRTDAEINCVFMRAQSGAVLTFSMMFFQ